MSIENSMKPGTLVRFNHERDGGPVHRVFGVGVDGMIELDDMGGFFAPHLFVIADDIGDIPPSQAQDPDPYAKGDVGDRLSEMAHALAMGGYRVDPAWIVALLDRAARALRNTPTYAALAESLFNVLGESNHKVPRWSQGAAPFEYWSREEIMRAIAEIEKIEARE